MTLQEYIREFVCQIEHFTDYIEDAIECPDLVDFDVIRGKISMVRKQMEGVELQLGVVRKDKVKRNEDRTNRPSSKVPQRKEVLDQSRQTRAARGTRTPTRQPTARSQGGRTRRKR